MKSKSTTRLACIAIWIMSVFYFSCQNADATTDPPPIRVMSFNIRYNNPNDGDNAWPNRKDLVANMIRFYDPDLLGVQEALTDQVSALQERLPGYARVGVGRDDGKEQGEYTAIFYRENRFELQTGETFWLSETPSEKGSIGWDAACVRIVTWIKLKDRLSKKMFYLFNTHFDHRGPLARRKSAEMLLNQAYRLAAGLPIIVTGDFNSIDTSQVYKILTNTGDIKSNLNRHFKDAKLISKIPPFGPDNTFNGFGRSEKNQRIDYIFISEAVSVLRHGILSEHWGSVYLSDHMPVLADVLIQ